MAVFCWRPVSLRDNRNWWWWRQLNAQIRNEKLSTLFSMTCTNSVRDPVVVLRTSRWCSTSSQKFYKGCSRFAIAFLIQWFKLLNVIGIDRTSIPSFKKSHRKNVEGTRSGDRGGRNTAQANFYSRSHLIVEERWCPNTLKKQKLVCFSGSLGINHNFEISR